MYQVECGFVNQIQSLVQFGPTLQVQIGFDRSYRPTDDPVPNLPSNSYHALIDTGAAMSCIDSQIAASLGLPVIDEQPTSGIHGSEMVNVHLAQIHIPALPFTIYGQFYGVHLIAGGQPHGALLGRDFLRYMQMTYVGDTGSVIVSVFNRK